MNAKIKTWLRDGLSLIAVVVVASWLGMQAPTWYKQFKGPFKQGDYTQHVKEQPYALTLYGTTTCPHCKTAREFLKKAGISFNDQIIDESPAAKELFKTLGENGVPVLVSSEKLFAGFNQEAYQKLAATVKTK